MVEKYLSVVDEEANSEHWSEQFLGDEEMEKLESNKFYLPKALIMTVASYLNDY